jgi:hypothetical protein
MARAWTAEEYKSSDSQVGPTVLLLSSIVSIGLERCVRDVLRRVYNSMTIPVLEKLCALHHPTAPPSRHQISNLCLSFLTEGTDEVGPFIRS